MKKIYLVVLAILGLLVVVGCSPTGNTTLQKESVVLTGNIHEATLQVKGMYCASCAMGVEAQLKRVEGVIDADVSYKTGKCTVRYDADKVSAETIAQASTVYPANVVGDKAI